MYFNRSTDEKGTEAGSSIKVEQNPQIPLEPVRVGVQLVAGDADRLPTGEQERPVAQTVVLEGVIGRVGVGVVELGDDVPFAPGAVGLVGAIAGLDERVDLGHRQTPGIEEGEEVELEAAAGADGTEAAAGKGSADDRRSSAPGIAHEQVVQGDGVGAAQELGLAQSGMEGLGAGG